jgi:hypothetical protein
MFRDRPLQQKAKWPIEFDLEGIPRDDQLRQTIMQERGYMAEKYVGPRDIDLNKPVTEPYFYQEFPKLVYHKDGRVLAVDGPEAQAQAESDGFGLKPFEKHDYSHIANGKVAPRPKFPEPKNAEVGF